MKFAAFIMTFEREEILADTIEKLLDQTLPPEEILIVDNSLTDKTRLFYENLNNARISYHHMGYNAGPSGASNYGLTNLAAKGYDWIFWGDDDDPPKFSREIEDLLNLVKDQRNVGAIGSVGSRFNYKTGFKERFKDNECSGILEADSIGGGYNLLINGTALRNSGIYPNPDLFFGFEEFEFLQRLKRKGYRILVSGDSLLKHRQFSNRLGIDNTRSIFPTRPKNQLKRDYYSYRNLIYTMIYTFQNRKLGLKIILRAISKVPVGFLKGAHYGIINSKMMFMAIYHALFKKLGKRY